MNNSIQEESVIKSSRLISVEKHLEGLKSLNISEDLNNAVKEWEDVLSIDTYIKDGVMHINESTYCDIMTFVKWEIIKLNRIFCHCKGLWSEGIKMDLE